MGEVVADRDASLSVVVVSFAAGDGDCILLRCRTGTTWFNMLVDGGRSSATIALKQYLASLPEGERAIDLFVVTHIDSDHIEGAIDILRDAGLRALVKDVWFNDARRAAQVDGIPLSTAQGDDLADLLKRIGLVPNRHLDGGAIVLDGREADVVDLGPDTSLRILGPNRAALAGLAAVWPHVDAEGDDAEEFGGAVAMGEDMPDVEALATSAFRPDASVTNRSSIVLVLRHGGTSVLLASDAWAEDLVTAFEADGTLTRTTFALATLPHHGSRSNLSPALARLVDAERWLVSTDGSRRHRHPHAQAIARILRDRPGDGDLQLVFNSRHPETLRWDEDQLKSEYRFETLYPAAPEPWVTVTLDGPVGSSEAACPS